MHRITMNVPVVVNIDNARNADEAVVQARDQVVAFTGDVANIEVGAINVEEVARVCVACGGAIDDLDTFGMCPGCIMRALRVHVLIDTVHAMTRDDEVRRALDVLRTEDNVMRASGMPYVDSHASAWDAIMGDDDMIAACADDVTRAIRDNVGNVYPCACGEVV